MKFLIILLFVFFPTAFWGIDSHLVIDLQLENEYEPYVSHVFGESALLNPYFSGYVLKTIDKSSRIIILDDDSKWNVGRLDSDILKRWEPGQQVVVYYQKSFFNSFKIKNINEGSEVSASIQLNSPVKNQIVQILMSSANTKQENIVILKDGLIFQGPKINWKVCDAVFVLHQPVSDKYDLLNLSNHELSKDWVLTGKENVRDYAGILNFEYNLNAHVLGQEEAVSAVAMSIFNYWAGLNDPHTPIGVFLFLGPTGVGKTELAKALNKELFQNTHDLIRFDMSHFAEAHTISRLLGSPPGYVNHEEGGQLSEALKKYPFSIVLLDEIEKAHSEVRKSFLPIFDEGDLRDAKNNKIACHQNIFIMTSNICSKEIDYLFQEGYSSEEILELIEPAIMEQLSPEFYNRVFPVLFRPITQEWMAALVDLRLQEVVERLKRVKNMTLIIENSVKEFLIVNGFHPHLGARPLKRLIQSKVMAALSYAIVKDNIPSGSILNLSYCPVSHLWHVIWREPSYESSSCSIFQSNFSQSELSK